MALEGSLPCSQEPFLKSKPSNTWLQPRSYFLVSFSILTSHPCLRFQLISYLQVSPLAFLCHSYLCQAWYMTFPFHPPLFDRLNNINNKYKLWALHYALFFAFSIGSICFHAELLKSLCSLWGVRLDAFLTSAVNVARPSSPLNCFIPGETASGIHRRAMSMGSTSVWMQRLRHILHLPGTEPRLSSPHTDPLLDELLHQMAWHYASRSLFSVTNSSLICGRCRFYNWFVQFFIPSFLNLFRVLACTYNIPNYFCKHTPIIEWNTM